MLRNLKDFLNAFIRQVDRYDNYQIILEADSVD